MQKRSHARLASALLNCENVSPVRRYKWAFLLGSVQPDCNPLSYLKGSLHHKKFGGHTYANSRRYIETRIRRLQKRRHWTVWQYYTLGKLTHYVADAFTYPHNSHFPEHGWAHHTYETRLRTEFAEYLDSAELCRTERVKDLPAELYRLHEEYMAAGSSPERDISYILRANALLMADCRNALGA